MKRPSLIFLLILVLAGGALGAMPAPSCAQVYAAYTYPPPPQNVYAAPWVGPNTPWVYYQGDWFLHGILHHFFGKQYGWAPYYAYPPTYIVRPTIWYAPKWKAWYQGHPHYWRHFEQKYPYWRGHRAGQRYDEHFYNQHHRGHGRGWHHGFHGVRPATPAGPHIRAHGSAGPGVSPAPAAAPHVRPAQPAAGPGVRPAQPAAPVVRPAPPAGPSLRTAQAAGPGGRDPGAAGRGAPAPGVQKPEKAPRGAEKPQS